MKWWMREESITLPLQSTKCNFGLCISPPNPPFNCSVSYLDTAPCMEVTCAPGKLSCWIFYCCEFKSLYMVFTPISSKLLFFPPSFYLQTDWIRLLDSGDILFFSSTRHIRSYTHTHTHATSCILILCLLFFPAPFFAFRLISALLQAHSNATSICLPGAAA